MRVLQACALGIGIVTAACSGQSARPAGLDGAAERYARLVLALGDRDSDSLDMYRGPADWQQDAQRRQATLASIRTAAHELTDHLAAASGAAADSADAGVRRAFLARQLGALVSRVDILLGARPAFRDETRQLFGLDVTVPRADGSAEIRQEIDQLLPGGGSLTARYAAFDRRFLIPSDRLPAVFGRAIEGCRAITRSNVTLPPNERVEVLFVRESPWSAYTRYRGGFRSDITVNVSLPITVDRALDLACHEGYPGHHVIHALLEQRFGSSRAELLVQPLFSPQSMLHEAAAAVAPLVAFGDAARLAFERDELFPLAGLDASDAERYVRVGRLVDQLHREEERIAADYLDGRLDFPRAAAALERDALMPSADATLKFLNQFRSYAATYTAGRDAFSDSVAEGAGLNWYGYVNAVTDPAQRLPSREPDRRTPAGARP